MSIFVERRVRLQEDDWRTCKICNGTGLVIHKANDQIPFETKDECPNMLCDDGTVKFGYRRISQAADQRANDALVERNYGDNR